MGKKIKVDGKEYDLDDFDDTRGWSKPKKRTSSKGGGRIKSNESNSSSGFMGHMNTEWV